MIAFITIINYPIILVIIHLSLFRGKGVLSSKQNGSANGALAAAETPRLTSVYDIRHKNPKDPAPFPPGFHPPVIESTVRGVVIRVVSIKLIDLID